MSALALYYRSRAYGRVASAWSGDITYRIIPIMTVT
jgi:hypothetical protein